MSKQIVKVYYAVRLGFETSREVADVTGLSLPAASSYLSELYAIGMLDRDLDWWGKMGKRGPLSFRYSESSESCSERLNNGE